MRSTSPHQIYVGSVSRHVEQGYYRQPRSYKRPFRIRSMDESEGPRSEESPSPQAIVAALDEQEPAQPTDSLIAQLQGGPEQNPDTWVPHTSEIESLVAADSPEVRNAAVLALGSLAKTHPEAVADIAPALRDALSDSDPAVRAHAAWALGHVGTERPAIIEPVVDELTALLDEGPGSREDATWALGHVARESPTLLEPYIDRYCSLLDAEREEVRTNAAWILDHLSTDYPIEIAGSTDKLLDNLDSDDERLRGYAASCLAQVIVADPAVVEGDVNRLVAHTSDEQVSVRRDVHASLAAVAAENPTAVRPAVPDAVIALEDEDELVRRNAAGVLAYLGSVAPDVILGALPTLMYLDDDVPAVQQNAQVAIEAIEQVYPETVERVGDRGEQKPDG